MPSKCAECEMVFDGETMFAVIKGKRICEDCIDAMTSRELLEKLGIELDCIGVPEPERL